MIWFVYALLSAIFLSLTEIFQKRALFKERSIEFGLERSVFALLMVLIFIPFIDWNVSFVTLLIVFFVSLIFAIADLYRSKGYKHMAISSAAPFYNLLPAFVALLSMFFLGETLSLKQISGIVVLMIGAYVLEVDHNIHSLFSPIKKIIKSKYIHLIFIALLLFGIGSIFEKQIIDFYLKPLQFLFIFLVFFSLNYFLISFFKHGVKGIVKSFKQAKIDSLFSALFWNLEMFFYLTALKLQMVSLVVPIKRMHVIFTTMGGGTIFKDKGLYLKAVACTIMFVGVLLMVL